MRLYILRHGDAENKSVLHPRDFERPLTQKARGDLQYAASRMPGVLGALDRIVSSPLMRARQTAEIVSEAYGNTPMVEVRNELDGDASPAALANLLINTMGHPQILMVGHKPNVDQLIAYLVAPDEYRVVTNMEPGGLAAVHIETPFERKGSLLALIPLQVW